MDIKVNKQEWLSLSDEDRKRMEEILKEAGSIDSGDKIVGDPGVTSFTESNLTARDGPMPSCMHRRLQSSQPPL